MTTNEQTGTRRDDGKPQGSQPTRKSDRQDEKIREDAKRESGGGAPLDPADKPFIEKNK